MIIFVTKQGDFVEKDVRWTGVLEKRDRKWVIVQQHMSAAFG
jgi:hypothetical protein